MNCVMVILSGPESWITRESELLLLLKNQVNTADLRHLDIEESRSTGCYLWVKYNVIKVKIVYDYSKKVSVPQSAESWIAYKQVSDEMLKITYDDKPSPYTAISKYWKFTGQDFSGFGAYNLDKLRFWVGHCEILSKNNPVKITGSLITAGGQPPATNASFKIIHS